MKPTISIIVVFAVVLSLGLITSPASAQIGYGGAGFGWGQSNWLGSWFERPYASGRVPTPPYFALHPPVYYSYPIPRTYGYSPFAYPGWVRTPEVEIEPQPEEIINPHATQKKKANEAAARSNDKVAGLPKKAQMIINPFYANPNYLPGIDLETHLASSGDQK